MMLVRSEISLFQSGIFTMPHGTNFVVRLQLGKEDDLGFELEMERWLHGCWVQASSSRAVTQSYAVQMERLSDPGCGSWAPCRSMLNQVA